MYEKRKCHQGRILKEKAQMVRVNVPLVIDGKELARSTCHSQKSATNDRLSKALETFGRRSRGL